jgi:hypothetical protein
MIPPQEQQRPVMLVGDKTTGRDCDSIEAANHPRY